MEPEYVDSQDTLISFINNHSINNILLGNGVCLSHPDFSSCFTWDSTKVLIPIWESFAPTSSTGCPESDLNNIRINITKSILQHYINCLFEKLLPSSSTKKIPDLYKKYYSAESYSCYEILENISNKNGNIFTLNYDPLVYFEMLKYSSLFVDGFISQSDNRKDGCFNQYYSQEIPGDHLMQAYISCKLNYEASSKIFYLHGSWFILINDNQELGKLKFSGASSETVEDLFEATIKPYLILEDRSHTKEILIKGSEYFSCCYSSLKNTTGNILVFGVSFEKDDHILEALDKSIFKEVFITYIRDEDKENISAKIARLNQIDLQTKTHYVRIGENSFWKKIHHYPHTHPQ